VARPPVRLHASSRPQQAQEIEIGASAHNRSWLDAINGDKWRITRRIEHAPARKLRLVMPQEDEQRISMGALNPRMPTAMRWGARATVIQMTPTCPRCGGAASFALRAEDRNRMAGRGQFEYWRCDACGVLWQPDIPQDLGAHYPADYHPSLAPSELEPAIAAEQPRVDLVAEHVEPGQMVEIGPSQGIFALAAARAGFDVVAMEMDPDCCRQVTDRGVRAIHTAAPQEELPKLGPSRAAVLWHVIEHLPDPWAVLRAIGANLEPGGVLALATPNPDSFQFRAFGARWVHLDAPRHLTLIPLAALREEAARQDLALVNATASDRVGLGLNRLGWQRSFLRPPALRPDPRFAYTLGEVFGRTLGAWEARGLRGAAYTAVFVKGTA